MIAYEIQLQYVIRDKIQSETKFSPRQNLRIFFFPTKFFFAGKNFFIRKKILGFCLGLNLSQIPSALILSCLGQIDAYHH